MILLPQNCVLRPHIPEHYLKIIYRHWVFRVLSDNVNLCTDHFVWQEAIVEIVAVWKDEPKKNHFIAVSRVSPNSTGASIIGQVSFG